MRPIRVVAILGWIAAGCSTEPGTPPSRTPQEFAAHFERGGSSVRVEEEDGTLPGGAVERWKVHIQDPIRKRLGYDGSGHLFAFRVPRMAEDYARALEGTRDLAKASGLNVLVLRKPRHGFTDMTQAAVPATAGLKDAWTRWHELAPDAPPGGAPPSDAARAALEAGQRLFDEEWSACVSDLFALFGTFSPEPH